MYVPASFFLSFMDCLNIITNSWILPVIVDDMHTHMHTHTCLHVHVCVQYTWAQMFLNTAPYLPASTLPIAFLLCTILPAGTKTVYEDLRIKIKTFPLVIVALFLCYSLCVPCQFPSGWETAETEREGCSESQRSVSRHWLWRPCACTVEPAVKSWLTGDYASLPWMFKNTLHSKPLSVCTLCVCVRVSFT